MTSHDIVAIARKKLQTREIGHIGTLDPLAQGLMVLCVGFATKLVDYLIRHDKVYQVQGRLFASSASYDMGTEVTELPHKQISKQRFFEVLEQFKGPHMQMPPIYSALKIEGQKACDIARKGGTINLEKRPVNFYSIECTKFDGINFELTAHCSSGTYIRSLVHDIGTALQTNAIMTFLERTKIEDFLLTDACVPENISADKLVGVEYFKNIFPWFDIADEEKEKIKHGQSFFTSIENLKFNTQNSKPDTLSKPLLLFYKGEMVAIAKYEDGKIFPKKVRSEIMDTF